MIMWISIRSICRSDRVAIVDCVHETDIWIKLDKVNENENYIKN